MAIPLKSKLTRQAIEQITACAAGDVVVWA